MSLKIKVPASSANLGPGFDCFGIAWQLYNTIEFKPGKQTDKDNLVYQSLCHTLGREIDFNVNFIQTDVPISRGLGSSSTCIVAGVMAANEIGNLGMSKLDILNKATEIEGHPDNVAPAILGGLIVSTMDNKNPVYAEFDIDKSWKFTVLIPDFELSTEKARSVLPDTYSKSDAIFNIAHSALLLKALENGDENLLSIGLKDRIHQPYRFPLIEGGEEIVKTPGICISGAGSTLLFIHKGNDNISLPNGWIKKDVDIDFEGAVIL